MSLDYIRFKHLWLTNRTTQIVKRDLVSKLVPSCCASLRNRTHNCSAC